MSDERELHMGWFIEYELEDIEVGDIFSPIFAVYFFNATFYSTENPSS